MNDRQADTTIEDERDKTPREGRSVLVGIILAYLVLVVATGIGLYFVGNAVLRLW